MDFSFPEICCDNLRARYKDNFSVSAFDHWLTEGECGSQPFMFYQDAVDNDRVADYQIIEDRFLYLFGNLIGNDFVLFNRSRSLEPKSVFKNKKFLGFKPQVVKLITRMVREHYIDDFYLPQYRLRIKGGYDLTHHFYFEDEVFVEPVVKIVRDAGLHILR
jgi:hypothetical protein